MDAVRAKQFALALLVLLAGMEPRIEKGLPLPVRKTWRTLDERYPFAKLEVGDSFFAPEMHTGPFNPCFGRLKRLTGRSYTAKLEKGGVRVWRVS